MLGLLLMLLAQAQPAPPLPPRCGDAAHAAYDFFVGDWDVVDSRSHVMVAHSRIEKVMGGCAIKESFDQSVGPGNTTIDYHGTSYTALARDGRWRQFYVDTGGAATWFTGGIGNGAMVLTSEAGATMNRMTVAPQADGSVRQTGTVSTDGGKTWSAPGYDFSYRRRA